MVLFGSLLDHFVSCFVRVNFRIRRSLIHEFSSKVFFRWTLWIGTIILSESQGSKIENFMLKFMTVCRF